LARNYIEEIDYIHEGRNEKFATNFRNDPHVKIPSIYWRFSSNPCFNLEGLILSSRILAQRLDTNTFNSNWRYSGYATAVEHGFFHADPHPGNLFDGRWSDGIR